MLQFNSALLTIAGMFAGPCAPFQSIHIQPHSNGVLVASSDQGRVAFLGFDSCGVADETCDIIPEAGLLRACTGIKSADRDVLIEGDSARVTTYRKTASNEVKEFHVLRSSLPFPPIQAAIDACIQRWSATPDVSATAGRYASPILTEAVRAASSCSDSIVLSAFDGGPLRIQCEALDMLILVMPQTAEPIPALPDWVCSFAQARP